MQWCKYAVIGRAVNGGTVHGIDPPMGLGTVWLHVNVSVQ